MAQGPESIERHPVLFTAMRGSGKEGARGGLNLMPYLRALFSRFRARLALLAIYPPNNPLFYSGEGASERLLNHANILTY
jgi:hypothetical protein